MLDIKFIRENPEKVKNGAKNKNVDIEIEGLLVLDEKRRTFLPEVENLRAEQNKTGGEVASLAGKEKEKKIESLRLLKEKLRQKEEQLAVLERDIYNLLLQVPNIPFENVPVGKNESENKVLRVWGEKPKKDFTPKDYLELGENLDIIDVRRATKVSGSRFGYLKGGAALLEFALINYVFDTLKKEGFRPVVPPVLISEKAMRGMGYLERQGEGEIYKIEKDNLYLVGTSEQAIGPMHMDEILEEKALPLRYAAFSTCFRREAGSYGKDTRGILRVHQFDKVEMFSFCHPFHSITEHNFFLELEEKIMQGLNLPYRVIRLCTGDLGNSSASTYDIEAWIPSEARYRETHSTSNTTDFQTRRLNIRYRNKEDGKLNFVHAINGTGIAIGRAIIAILENYQKKDGEVEVPEVLREYIKVDVLRFH